MITLLNIQKFVGDFTKDVSILKSLFNKYMHKIFDIGF